MPIRMEQYQSSAIRVAEHLRERPEVAAVHHPAFCDQSKSLTGYSGLFSFELKNGELDQVRAFTNGLKRFLIGISWGGVESLVISVTRANNLAYLDSQRFPHGLIRLSIGHEGADQLIEDIELRSTRCPDQRLQCLS
jgi:cystathionine beta-lyase/cystathionine gamma-synthase